MNRTTAIAMHFVIAALSITMSMPAFAGQADQETDHKADQAGDKDVAPNVNSSVDIKRNNDEGRDSKAGKPSEPESLLTRIGKWQYPKSEMSGAVMGDGGKYDANGQRTVPSTQCRAVFKTPDSVEKVLAYYKSKLVHDYDEKRPEDSIDDDKTKARSVTFQSLANHPSIAMHVVMVNETQKSTTLVITRAVGDSDTHVIWSQFHEFAVPTAYSGFRN